MPKPEPENFYPASRQHCMRAYKFEHTDQAFTIKLLVVCFAVAFLLLGSILITQNYIGDTAGLIIAIVVPAIIFFIGVKKVKLNSVATLADTYLLLQTNDLNQKIEFSDLNRYEGNTLSGVKIHLYFKDGRKLTLQANEAFCNPKDFGIFCADLIDTLDEYFDAVRTGEKLKV